MCGFFFNFYFFFMNGRPSYNKQNFSAYLGIFLNVPGRLLCRWEYALRCILLSFVHFWILRISLSACLSIIMLHGSWAQLPLTLNCIIMLFQKDLHASFSVLIDINKRLIEDSFYTVLYLEMLVVLVLCDVMHFVTIRHRALHVPRELYSLQRE